MAILDIEPGQSPEAPAVLSFFEQGRDPSTGFQVSSSGAISGSVSSTYTGATGATDVITSKVTGDAGFRFVIDADGSMHWGDGTGALDPLTDLYRGGSGVLRTDAYFQLAGGQADGDFTVFGTNFTIGSAGGKIRVKEGANATMGTATLVAGTVTVNTTAVTANSRIFLTAQTSGAGPGALRVSARVAATSFTITSTNAADTSLVAWWIVEPAP